MRISDIIEFVRLPFVKDRALRKSLKNILGFYPRDIELYKLALSHKSAVRRSQSGKRIDNERLEFLGDAILGAVVGDIVYRHFPNKNEGFLTTTRSKLVKRETLGILAREMGLSSLIIKHEQHQAHNSYMGGNAFEALVGAAYLDRGYSACMRFMKKRILKQMINIDRLAKKETNFKSKLLEWSQKNKVFVHFNLLEQARDEKANLKFKYAVVIENVITCGTGTGYSKKEAQQIAARETLRMLKHDAYLLDNVFAAKAQRTQMEEMPVAIVPDVPEVNKQPKEQPKPREEKKEPTPEPKKEIAVPEKQKQQMPMPKPEQATKAEEQKPKEQKEAPKAKKESPSKKKETTPKEKVTTPKENKENTSKGKETAPKAKKETAAKRKPQPKAKKEGSEAKEKRPLTKGKEAINQDKKAQQPAPAKEKKARRPKKPAKEEKVVESATKAPEKVAEVVDEFDLSDITARPKTQEEIIAAAEEAAWSAE